MAIEIQKRPYNYCFSGNPVHYQLYSALAAADDKVFFQVRVQFKNIGGVYTFTEPLDYAPYQGVATIDVQDILEGLLTHQLPQFAADEKTIWEVQKHTGKFYLEYREITPFNQNPSWDNSEMDSACFIVKGGLSRFKYQGNNFWISYFGITTANMQFPFLTWQVRNRLATVKERMYLLFLNVTDAPNFNITGVATYTDGTTFSVLKFYQNASKGVCYYVPAGADQWGLLNAAKNINFWEITVFNPVTNLPISESFRYYADNRNDYNDLTLSYRNSLGGIDSVRVRGIIQYDLDYDYNEQGKTVRPDYFSGHFFDPQKIITNNKELQILRGDIGYLEKEEQDRLRDAFIKRETWWAVSKKWWPVNIITKNIKQKNTDNTRWSLPIDFSLAHDGDNLYTPQSVDLGVGVFTDNVCLAYLSAIDILNEYDATYPDGTKKITINFTENDPQNASNFIRYRILDANGVVVKDWTIVAMGAPVVFGLAINALYNYEIQPLCTNDYPGKKTTGQIDLQPTAPPPPPPPGTSNSVIDNRSSFRLRVNVDFNPPGTNFTTIVGANNQYNFTIADQAASGITVLFIGANSPSQVSIFSNGIEYIGQYVSGTEWFFDQVNIVNGLIILIQ